jgi:hypothetical protein
VFDVARGAIKVNVSDRLREALERLDQAIDRLDMSATAATGSTAADTADTHSAGTTMLAARLDRMIQRVEAALAD